MKYSSIHTSDAMEQMNNPLSPIKMVRESYSRYLQKNFTEVQVQFMDEEPAWIPYETLLAMQQSKGVI
tara:strand:- start:121 stop:324 length:204 start_codon:yes stop_codon:yes gene_type:complete